jgi:hypothetical protein
MNSENHADGEIRSYNIGDYGSTEGRKMYFVVHFIIETAPKAGQEIVWEINYSVVENHAQGNQPSESPVSLTITHVMDGTEMANSHQTSMGGDEQEFNIPKPDSIVLVKAKMLSKTIEGEIPLMIIDLLI